MRLLVRCHQKNSRFLYAERSIPVASMVIPMINEPLSGRISERKQPEPIAVGVSFAVGMARAHSNVGFVSSKRPNPAPPLDIRPGWVQYLFKFS